MVGGRLTRNILGDINAALDDLMLPYIVDLSLLTDIDHVPLRKHIEGVGVGICENKTEDLPESTGKIGWGTAKLGEVAEVLQMKDLEKILK